MISFLNRSREFELNNILSRLREKQILSEQGREILDLGAGSGYIAEQLAGKGFQVSAIEPFPLPPLFFPMTRGYGQHLPYRDLSFDAIVSLHVLEHIPEPHLSATLSEIHRILRPEGVVVLALPTTVANALTMLEQPIGNFLYLIRRFQGARNANRPAGPATAGRGISKAKTSRIIWRLTLGWFLDMPHGTSKTRVHELWDWRERVWRMRIDAHGGFKIVDYFHVPLTYSQHMITGVSTWRIRRFLGQMGLASTQVFLLQKV